MLNVRVSNNIDRKNIIVSEEITVAEAFNQAGIEIGNRAVTVDGYTINNDDLDRPLSDFGVNESCRLSATQKLDNAVTVKVAGDAMVVETEISYDDIELCGKFKPDALITKDDNGEPVFAIGVGSSPSLNKYGAVFNGASRDESRKATLTLFNEFGDDPKENIVMKFGTALTEIEKLEEKVPSVIGEIKAHLDSVREKVTVQ